MSMSEAEETLTQTPAMAARPKVLVVDDEQAVRQAISLALAREGYALYGAANGFEGLEIARQEAPELIFLDLKMPVMDGYDFMAEVGALRPDLPFTIVAITGHGDDQEIDRCYRQGIDFFLKKPLNMVEICGLARRSIKLTMLGRERRRLLAELRQAHDEMEQKVEDRTRDLRKVVDRLESEIDGHKRTTGELQQKTAELEETNIALQVLLKRRDREKDEFEQEVNENINRLIRPGIEKLRASTLSEGQRNQIDLLEMNLQQVANPVRYTLRPSGLVKLTAAETQVANLIRRNKTSKEIAALLNVSVRTIDTHRDNIREKLGIRNTPDNLREYLLRIL